MTKTRTNHLNANNLFSANPTLAGEWHPTRNGSLTPGNVTPKSHKKAWWLCQKGHQWEATINSRSPLIAEAKEEGARTVQATESGW